MLHQKVLKLQTIYTMNLKTIKPKVELKVKFRK